MIENQDLLKLFRKETATTLKAMRALPEDKLLFTPHERSSNARNVMRTFVFEMYLIESCVFGEEIDRSRFQTYAPDKPATLIDDFEKEAAHVVSAMEKLSETDMSKPVEFAGKEFAASEFMLMMLFDQIHHRGQLTTYIRMPGGKVPSIYGPSADDPSRNF